MIITSVLSTTIEKAEVIDFYKTLLENQSSNYSVLINSFIAITVLLIGSTWIWNFVIAKKQIKNEVEQQIKVIKDSLKNEYDNYLQNEIVRIEKLLADKFLSNEAMLMDSLCLQFAGNGEYHNTINFAILSLEKYLRLNKEDTIRASVDSILVMLSNPTLIQLINPNKIHYDILLSIINKIPNILNVEKIKIVDILQSIREKI